MRYVILLLALFMCVFGSASAASLPVYPNGVATVTIPVNSYLSVFTVGGGSATVKQLVGGPGTGFPPRYAEMTGSPVSNAEYVFAQFTTGGTVRIEAGADIVWYSVSPLTVVTPVLRPGPINARDQQAPVTQTTSVTALSTDLLNGIVVYTNTTGATVTYTLPTGTLLDAAAGLGINQGFEWSIINTSSTANTITLAAGSGHTIVGDAITQGQSQATGGNGSRWFTRKTAANTFITYRIN